MTSHNDKERKIAACEKKIAVFQIIQIVMPVVTLVLAFCLPNYYFVDFDDSMKKMTTVIFFILAMGQFLLIRLIMIPILRAQLQWLKKRP